MKQWIGVAVVLALWAPAILLDRDIIKSYGSESNAPFVSILLVGALVIAPYYVIFAKDGKYLTALEKLLGINDDK